MFIASYLSRMQITEGSEFQYSNYNTDELHKRFHPRHHNHHNYNLFHYHRHHRTILT